MFCKYCGKTVHEKAIICPGCGCSINNADAVSEKKEIKEITIKTGNEDSSYLFPVLSLLGYILLYPVGLIMNIIGLFLGKRKGCFVSLFVFFVILPIAIYVMIIVVAGGVALSSEC